MGDDEKNTDLTRGSITASLRDAFEKNGCPLCRTQRQMEERWLWRVLYELTRDQDVRSDFDRLSGLCHGHSRLALRVIDERELVGGHNLARIYGTVIKCLLDRMSNGGSYGYSEEPSSFFSCLVRGPRSEAPSKENGCPLCLRVEERGREHARALLDVVNDESGRDGYLRSDGLCHPHFRRVLRVAEGNCQREMIWKDHSQRLETLERNLQNLLRKRRYDSTQSISPEEARSWREALWRCSGMIYDTPLVNRQSG